ncbi:thioredoxin family protein [Bacillus sp. BRMEA1]|uniref:thioredoxin family protein n=1 Tax=Neobacillus endophyticus TaxID=2738405 RepID=UPI0015642269|nr:thioredoxin family protein [Neobacillus endophyticus]NRD77715.1 thioredoxin family protein [Neobacillus endophyticus]
MELNAWFQKGMTADEYIGSMNQNKQEMLSILNQFTLKDEDISKLEGLRDQQLRAIVLTEDWCGDALLNNPILLKIAEAAGIEIRFILRDQNLELMDQYLTNGTSRAIPIFIFINQDGEEVGVWGPRAPEIQARVEKERAGLPEKEAPDFQEKQMEMYKRLRESYQKDDAIWQTVANSIQSVLLS